MKVREVGAADAAREAVVGEIVEREVVAALQVDVRLPPHRVESGMVSRTLRGWHSSRRDATSAAATMASQASAVASRPRLSSAARIVARHWGAPTSLNCPTASEATSIRGEFA